MAVTLGTDSGFVSSAPSGDPGGSTFGPIVDDRANNTHDTTPADSGITITEMGWWCNQASEAANFEIGIYAADGEVVPGEAGTLLEVDTSNAKGTDAGWKRTTGLNWSVDSSTPYWLAFQLDDITTTTRTDHNPDGGTGRDQLGAPQTALPTPWGGGALSDSDAMLSIYALWEAEAPPPPIFTAVNIGDVWKTVSGSNVIKVNVGDAWKNVTSAKVNIGDAWKAVTIS